MVPGGGGPGEPGGVDVDWNCNDSGTWAGTGPLMSTRWGQRGIFNDLAPDLGCANDPGGQAPTGCVATAMAQVMKYHEWPANYNWADMPDVVGTMETARLMRDIGDLIDMDYQCDGSGAQMGDAASALDDDFGFTTVQLRGYDVPITIAEVRALRPVILAGYTPAPVCWWIFCRDGIDGGHAWVCDGTLVPPHCPEHPDYNHYLYMNWGWSGFENGYFGYFAWTPANNDFTANRQMLTLRKP